MSDDTQVKQEADRRKILKVINARVLASHRLNSDPCNFVINQNSLADALVDLLATARREAFKEAITLVQSVTNENDLDDGGFFEAGFIAARTKSIDALIDASATEKGEMNGEPPATDKH